jgi:hypothetical protein
MLIRSTIVIESSPEQKTDPIYDPEPDPETGLQPDVSATEPDAEPSTELI